VTIMMRSLRRKTGQQGSLRMVFRAIGMVRAGAALPIAVQTNPLTDSKHMLMSITSQVRPWGWTQGKGEVKEGSTQP
jgi:hypothetical protein